MSTLVFGKVYCMNVSIQQVLYMLILLLQKKLYFEVMLKRNMRWQKKTDK